MALPFYTQPGLLPPAQNEGLLGGNPLLNIGLGILANNTGNYGNAGAALGRGAIQGIQQTQLYRQQGLQNRLAQLQIENAERTSEQEKSKMKALPDVIAAVKGTPTARGPYADPDKAFGVPDLEEALLRYDPEGYIKRKLTPKDPVKLGEGDILFDPNSGKPVFTAPKTPEAPKTRTVRKGNEDVTEEWVPSEMKWVEVGRGAAFKGTPDSVTTVNVNTDKKYGEIFSTKMAEQDAAAIDAAKGAPERIASARRVKDILAKNPITGTGAEARLAFNKALATAGIIDGTTVKNTEDLASQLAAGTLDAIRTSGLGAGQGFTDKDRQFLERAKSGNIEINADTLAYLADLNERSGYAAIERGNKVIKQLQNDPTLGSVGSRLEPVAAPPTAKAPAVPLPAKPSKLTLKKGTRYVTPKGELVWDGDGFVED